MSEKLKSPISGWVEEIHVERGESIQALAKVIRVIQIDPLWIDIRLVPVSQAKTLKVGQRAEVKFLGPDTENVEGKIIFIAKHADPSANTMTVRVEVANKSNRPAGEHVTATFTDSRKYEEAENGT